MAENLLLNVQLKLQEKWGFMPEIQLFEVQLRKRQAYWSRDQRTTTAKSTLQSAVVRVTMPSEGTESDDNTVLARGVTSKT